MAIAAACYSTGDGLSPPPNTFYFPVGLTTSAAGNVLYASNSDFDLQWNGGTVQSYDLNAIRNDTIRLLVGDYADNPFLSASQQNSWPTLPWASGSPSTADCPNTTTNPPPTDPDQPGTRLPLGEACAPPMSSEFYWRDSVVIGAFATDLQLASTGSRLFIPVRGDASLTWIDIANDLLPTPSGASYANGASPNATPGTYYPFFLGCGRDTTGRCDSLHHAGQATDPGNTRGNTMPGEPFGMAQSDDGTAIAITHQTETETSLFLTGVVPNVGVSSFDDFDPSIQFVLEGMPLGGNGIAAIPHDQAAVVYDPSNPLRPAFLQTSRSVAEIDLLRYYNDEGYQGAIDGGVVADGGSIIDAGGAVAVGSSLLRPFLIKEEAFPLSVNSSGTDSRGIAIDDSDRRACELGLLQSHPGLSTSDPSYIQCARLPARVFIANRTPASLVLGTIGALSADDGTYNPDQLSLYGQVALTNGPSNVYLAPIVDKNGNYSLRVFVVCFDSQVIYVFDPVSLAAGSSEPENIIRTGPGPFAMAFDPFDKNDVAMNAAVPFDTRATTTIQAAGDANDGKPALRKYRFAYVASFTDSYVQILDLDQSFRDDRLGGQSTFETMVYTLGVPTQPKGSQ